MQFVHRENQAIQHQGMKIRHSRSVAVEAVLFFQLGGDESWYVPLIHRGYAPDLDSPGMWALAGGYLDRDETGFACLQREVWEELGLDISQHQHVCTNRVAGQQPFGVYTQPDSNKQNIILWYGLQFVVDKLPKLLPQVGTDEIQAAEWYLVTDAISMDLAFGHDELIKERRSNLNI